MGIMVPLRVAAVLFQTVNYAICLLFCLRFLRTAQTEDENKDLITHHWDYGLFPTLRLICFGTLSFPPILHFDVWSFCIKRHQPQSAVLLGLC